MSLVERLRSTIRDVPDFPRAGILFRDLTPVLEDPGLFKELIVALAAPWRGAGLTRVAGVESRGFIFGAPLALELGVGFSLVRKAGKLPHKSDSAMEAWWWLNSPRERPWPPSSVRATPTAMRGPTRASATAGIR
jgi:adenine/guanine phosphoribosyltransferase-like PRPP-binding protein